MISVDLKRDLHRNLFVSCCLVMCGLLGCKLNSRAETRAAKAEPFRLLEHDERGPFLRAANLYGVFI